MAWIRQRYKVPAKRGGRVKYRETGQLGTITSASPSAPYIRIRLDGEKHSSVYHPTWQLKYLEDEK